MSGQENGLTLGGLAEKLGALTERLGGLERENERMHSENTGLRQEVVALKSSNKSEAVVESAWASKGPVSRRALLGKAVAAAVAAVAAGTLLTPREAKAAIFVGNDSITVDSETGRTAIYARTGSNTEAALDGYNSGASEGVSGYSSEGIGVRGTGGTNGVKGTGGGNGAGVLGEGGSSGPGVQGIGGNNVGVLGQGRIGVEGKSGTTGHGAVYGQHTGTSGYGVVGDGKGANSAGLLGRNTVAGGIGVQGQGNVIGVKGESTKGYGGHFSGAIAQVKLLPHSKAGRPTTGAHQKGELFLDSTAALFVCTASGTPGTWRRVTTTTA